MYIMVLDDLVDLNSLSKRSINKLLSYVTFQSLFLVFPGGISQRIKGASSLKLHTVRLSEVTTSFMVKGCQ